MPGYQSDERLLAIYGASNVNEVDWDFIDLSIAAVAAQEDLELDEVNAISRVSRDRFGHRTMLCYSGGFVLVRAKGMLKLRPVVEDTVSYTLADACAETDEWLDTGGRAWIHLTDGGRDVIAVFWSWDVSAKPGSPSARAVVEAERRRICEIVRRGIAAGG